MTKTVVIKEKPETTTEMVFQPSANVSASLPAESSLSCTSNKTEPKVDGSGKATDIVNSSSNKLTVTPLNETDDILKRSIVEDDKEVNLKKHKEDLNQSYEDKNEASSPNPDSNEYKSGGLIPSIADSPGGGHKEPSLDILIPTELDADMGIRSYGKNLSRDYSALPHVVPSEKSSPASNQPNSPKSLQIAISDTTGVEKKKSLQTRVLRSSNRCGSNSSGAPSRSTSPIVSDEQLDQTTLPETITMDARSGNSSLSLATRSELNENVLTIVFEDDKEATTSAAATVTTTPESTAMAEVSRKELHPKRRKLKASRTESKTSDSSGLNDIVVTNPSGTTSEPIPVTNCYQMFLDVRKQIDKKHKNLHPVIPKPPSGFKDYLMNKRNYVLAGNYNNRVVNTQNPMPANLHKQLIKLFVKQEKERQRLNLQHTVEKEKLVLSVEQEILRVHGRAARALANQLLPFSVCTILKDNEVYNIMTPEQEAKKNRHTRSRYNGRLFLSWLQEVDDKWEKIKESLLLRHHNEAESLHAVQKMDWGWKLKELQLCTYSSEPNIDEEHVPIVLVSDDLDLLPA